MLIGKIAGHPKVVLVAALMLTGVAGGIGAPVFRSLSSSGSFTDPGSQSARARDWIARATGTQASPTVLALVTTKADITSPGGRSATRRTVATLRQDRAVAHVTSFLSTQRRASISADGHSTIVAATLRAGIDDQGAAERLDKAFKRSRDVRLGGGAVAQWQTATQISRDLGRAETVAFPVLLLLSLLFLRNARAVFMPLAIGGASIVATFALMRLINEVHGLSIFAINLVTGLGLGLAIDYTLLLVNRFRDELDEGRPVDEAIAVTVASAGRTIAFSSLTVATALLSLVIFPLNFLKSMGIGGAAVALLSATSALLLGPAFLGLWGKRLARRAQATQQEGRRWARIARMVMGRPVLIATLAGTAMVALALPALRAEWTGIYTNVLPTQHSSRNVSDAIQRDFSAEEPSPVIAVLRAPADAGKTLNGYAQRIRALPGITNAMAPQPAGKDLWRINASAAGRPTEATAQRFVASIRRLRAPFATAIGGDAADFHDQQAAIARGLPPALGLLIASTVLILWLMTGSIILPIKALIMNLLTVGASLGVLTVIFQDGRLQGFLGYTSQGGIEPTDFLVVAAAVFGLSTDYGVFLLARIKELRDRGLDEREAIAAGLQRTGSIITAAAILLAVAIGAFVTSQVIFIKQVGLGTATGVLLDAFVVRALLVPALLALLGPWNWWSPKPLRRAHRRIGIDHHARKVIP